MERGLRIGSLYHGTEFTVSIKQMWFSVILDSDLINIGAIMYFSVIIANDSIIMENAMRLYYQFQ